MKFKLLIFAAVFAGILSGSTVAEEIINDEMRQAMEESRLSLQKSTEQMEQTMQKVVPEAADGFARMLNEIFQTFPPLISAMERNQVLSKAADQVQQEMQKSLAQINSDVATLPDSPNADSGEYIVSGSRNDNGRSLDFVFTQDSTVFEETAAALQNKQNRPNNKITDLSGREISLSRFTIETINGTPFLVCEQGDENIYLTGNNAYGLNARVLAKGENAGARARLFLKNFSNQKSE